jgi:hypothetical protein
MMIESILEELQWKNNKSHLINWSICDNNSYLRLPRSVLQAVDLNYCLKSNYLIRDCSVSTLANSRAFEPRVELNMNVNRISLVFWIKESSVFPT